MKVCHTCFKLLKVLDLEQFNIGFVFPSAIEQLVLLTFLAINGSEFTIPLWLANLSNLETLILRHGSDELSLPDNLWNMKKLKYLYIRYSRYEGGGGGVLPIDNLDDSSVSYELDKFTGAVIEWCIMEKQLRKFPNISKLKCLVRRSLHDKEYVDKFVFPDFSSELKSLDISGCRLPTYSAVRFEFSSLKNLKKLKLSGLHLYWEIFSVIGNQLPSLEVLKLERLKFEDEEECVWEMKWGEFTKLRILHVDYLPLRRWIACDDHEFDCFQKLVIGWPWCADLVELPSCLETIQTLEVIEFHRRSKTMKDLVTKIEEAQNDWGNSRLKITPRCFFIFI